MTVRSGYGVSKRRTGMSQADLEESDIFLTRLVRRMRSASVLVVTLRGLATEVCKNIVLAGIGKLTILDDADIQEEDLGSGFFFREEEVGQKVCLPLLNLAA
jgi:molybdopterin/thiamine biosynthesis adenylyltransferase